MAEVSITFKGGKDYDEPWITIKGETVEEVGSLLEGVRFMGVFPAVVAAAQEFQDKEHGNAVRAVQQVNPGAQVVQQLPDSMKPKCDHGQMIWQAKYSTKQKRNYEGFFCPNDVNGCKPQQFRWTN